MIQPIKQFSVTRLTVRGFKGYADSQTFCFGSMNLISGHMGVGKSSIADAIAFAITGVGFYAGAKIDHLYHQKARDLLVELEFEDENGKVRTLARRRKNDNMEITLDGGRVSQADLTIMFGERDLFLSMFNPQYFINILGPKGRNLLERYLPEIPKEEVLFQLSDPTRQLLETQEFLSAEAYAKQLRGQVSALEGMLTHLELSPKHKADLLARGLSEERIRQNMYRTLPRSRSARRLLAGLLSDFHNLEGVPGFYVNKGCWDIAGHEGLLVPYCDKEGYIQGLQIRLDEEIKPDRKYRWLSSRGMAHGTRSRSYIHVTGNIHAKTAYLTEGGLKGDVASYLDHDALFICFAGVTAIADLKDTLLSMENIEEVVVALDMDKLMNWRVRNALEKIMALVRSIPGIRVRLMNWNMTFKGVDDFYQARNYAAKRGVNILDMTSNFITIRLENLWKQEYPEQDRGFIHACEWEELTVPLEKLTADKPSDMKKARQYLALLRNGQAEFPPLVCVNNMVIDGLHRFWAYQQMGYQQVTIYQNKPWVMPMAA